MKSQNILIALIILCCEFSILAKANSTPGGGC